MGKAVFSRDLQQLREDVDEHDDDDKPYQEIDYLVHRAPPIFWTTPSSHTQLLAAYFPVEIVENIQLRVGKCV